MFAKEERDLWRKTMQAGDIPDRVRFAVQLYEKQRKQREPGEELRFWHGLGEAALVWLEEKEGKLVGRPANDERDQWRRKMLSGEVPDQVRLDIEQYKELRERPDWRASRFVECLGEAALLWLEGREEKTIL